jgi:NADPH-dependent 2,4-dienoyl-CoA reductase/sulfur reductase-like enzyme
MRIDIIPYNNFKSYYKSEFGKIPYNNMKINKPEIIIVGGGLAGSEAAWQAAMGGMRVRLYVMRPFLSTGAH